MRMLDFCCWIFSIKLSRRKRGVKKFLKAINLFLPLIINHKFFHFHKIHLISLRKKNFFSRHLNSSAHLNSLGSNTQLNCSFRFSCDQQSAHKKSGSLLFFFRACHCINDNMLQLKKKWKKMRKYESEFIRCDFAPIAVTFMTFLLL